MPATHRQLWGNRSTAVTVPRMDLIQVAAEQAATDSARDDADRAADNGVPDQTAANAAGHRPDGAIAAAATMVMIVAPAIVDMA